MKAFKTSAFKIKKKNVYLIIIGIILLMSGMFYNSFIKKVNPKALNIVKSKLDAINLYILRDAISSASLDKINIDDIMIINRNKAGEIDLIDFNLENSYLMLRNAMSEIQENINEIEKGNIKTLSFSDEDILENHKGLVIGIPLGLYYNNVFMANLGPKVPIKVKFIGNVLIGINTKITPYGINNSLIQVFLNINITEAIYFPIKPEKMNKEYELLVASKIIYGKIPNFYGTGINSNSPIITMPIS